MPWIERIVADFNTTINGYKVEERPSLAKHFEPGKPLRDGLREMGVVKQDRQMAALRDWPPAFSASFRAAIHAFLSSGSEGPITVAWAPGYDYELNVWQSTGAKDSPGGLTILARTRYPFDKHPSQRGIRNKDAKK